MLDDATVQQIADEAEQSDWDQFVETALTRPTVSSLTALTTFPKRMEQVAAGLADYNSGRVSHNLQDAVSIASALNKGERKVAAQLLMKRRALFRNNPNPTDADGKPLPQDRWGSSTEVTDAMLGHVRSGDPARLAQAKGLAGMVVALSLDPEDVPQVLARSGFDDDRSEAEKEAAKERVAVNRDNGAA